MDPLTLVLLLLIVAGIVILVVSQVRRGRTRSARLATLPPSGKTNTLAIVAFVLSFIASVPAIVLGHIALVQIGRKNESGHGLAVAALWIGYVGLGLFLIAIIIVPYYVSQGRYF
jgi:hypothetical protein